MAPGVSNFSCLMWELSQDKLVKLSQDSQDTVKRWLHGSPWFQMGMGCMGRMGSASGNCSNAGPVPKRNALVKIGER